MDSTTGVVLPMVIATGSVLIGSATGGPTSKRSNLGVVAGASIATFFLLVLEPSAPRLAHSLALLTAMSSLLIYGPSVAKAVNSIR